MPTVTATQNITGLTRSNTVVLSGKTDANAVTVFRDLGGNTGIPLGDAVIGRYGVWTYTASDLPDGTYDFKVLALSVVSNTSVFASAGASVIVDTTGPKLTAGQSDAGTTASTGIVLSGTVADGAGVGSVEVLDTNGASWTDLGPAVISGTNWQLTAGHLTAGAHNFVAVATDSLGNYSSVSTGATVTVVGSTDLQPALLRIVGNSDGGVTLLGKSAAGSTVKISDTSAGVTQSLGSVTAGSDGSFSLTTHTRISLATVNSFAATASNAAGQTGASLGLFQLSSAGSDTLSGTTGQSDVFATFLRTGQDVISGFETTRAVGAAHDVLNLSGTGYGGFSQVAPHISGTSSALVQLDATRSVTLLGVAASSLQASDFRFS